jgi:hypothetical protein
MLFSGFFSEEQVMRPGGKRGRELKKEAGIYGMPA